MNRVASIASIACLASASSARADDPDDAGASTAPGNTPPTVATPPVNRRPPTGTFHIGAGWDTDNGFGLGADITQSDLFGTGTMLSLDAMVDERKQRFIALFRDPELFGTSFQLDSAIVVKRDQFDQFTRDSAGVNFALSHLIAPHVKAWVGYKLEHVQLTPDTLDAPFDIYDVGAVQFGLEYNTTDRSLMPLRGTRVGSLIEIANSDLGSSENLSYVKTKSYMDTHRGLGHGLTLHLAGSFETIDSSNYLPEGEWLQFDGATQIRGYRPYSLGPRDAAGRVLGGNMAMFGRAELEQSLSSHYGISAVGFVDAGGIFNNRGTGELAMTTGFGLLWRSPIGPIGGYLAWPSFDAKPVFVFGIGGSL